VDDEFLNLLNSMGERRTKKVATRSQLRS